MKKQITFLADREETKAFYKLKGNGIVVAEVLRKALVEAAEKIDNE